MYTNLSPLQMEAFARLHRSPTQSLDFEEYRHGEKFAIWRLKSDPAVEYVEQWAPSAPHCHTKQSSAFFFLTPATVALGGSAVKGPRMELLVYLTRLQAVPGSVFHVPAYVFHSVEPPPGGGSAHFFIFNSAPRERTQSEYTDDTVVADRVHFLEAIEAQD